MKKTYRVVRYEEQKSESTGVAAGMWSVVEITARDVGFADNQAQAETMKNAFEKAAKQ